MKVLLSERQIQSALDDLYRKIVASLPADNRIGVIGIRTRGQTLAQRIVNRLKADRPDLQIDQGVLDITFYRDDLSRSGRAPLVRATEIDFNLDDLWVLLVDDVLQTGRSVRAAMDALTDFGRTKAIRLAVLIDRGGRELPVSADYAGTTVKVSPHVRVQLKLRETDDEEGAFTIHSD